MLLPLLVSTTVAHAVTVLCLRRSILTEKVSRRGFHVGREYAIDALEILCVREVMQTEVAALPSRVTVGEAQAMLAQLPRVARQRLFAAIGDNGDFLGVVTRRDLEHHAVADAAGGTGPDRPLAAIVRSHPTGAYPEESLRSVIHRMAETGLTCLPVIERKSPRVLLGKVSLNDMLKARVRQLEEERRRERVLPLELMVPFSCIVGGLSRKEPEPSVNRS